MAGLRSRGQTLLVDRSPSSFFDAVYAKRQARVRLRDEDPELFAGLQAASADARRGSVTAETLWLERGPWPGWPGTQDASEEHLGLLVLDGLLLRSVQLGDSVRSELIGPGDVVRPWDPDGEEASLPFGVRWEVVEEARLAVLDGDVLRSLCAWPGVVSRVVERASRRSSRLALQLAITDLRRVDQRLLLLLWHCADRWGRVRPDGVLVPVRVTHDVLAQLVGAHRPTVTSSLRRLTQAGLVRRCPDRSWLLAPDPPSWTTALREASTASRS
jgi:CRP-like cAMP-binding protein